MSYLKLAIEGNYHSPKHISKEYTAKFNHIIDFRIKKKIKVIAEDFIKKEYQEIVKPL